MNDNNTHHSHEHVVDKKGFICKIEDMGKKKTEKTIQYHKLRLKQHMFSLQKLWRHLWSIDNKQFPRDEEATALYLKRKIMNEAGVKLDSNMTNHFKALKEYNKKFDFALRQQQVINLTIMQLENGADPELILNILRQSQKEVTE